MDKNKYSVEPISDEVLEREAEIIEREMAQAEPIEVPEGAKERVKKKLQAQMEEYRKAQLYAQLSEEDRKAMGLGKELLRKQEQVVHYKKKPVKVYVALAAVLIMVLAMGITSVGGPEKVLQIVKSMVGEREVVKVNSDDANYVIEEESEEQAYQEIKDAFGVDIPKIVYKPKDLEFKSYIIDVDLQTAELIYEYKEERFVYFISTSYLEGSWGIDVEDKITDEYRIEREETVMEIREYETLETQTKRYSARFGFEELEYFCMGTMEKEYFEKILKDLFFP